MVALSRISSLTVRLYLLSDPFFASLSRSYHSYRTCVCALQARMCEAAWPAVAAACSAGPASPPWPQASIAAGSTVPEPQRWRLLNPASVKRCREPSAPHRIYEQGAGATCCVRTMCCKSLGPHRRCRHRLISPTAVYRAAVCQAVVCRKAAARCECTLLNSMGVVGGATAACICRAANLTGYMY